MKHRLVSFGLLWLGAVLALVLGGALGGALIVAVAAARGQYELYRLLQRLGYPAFPRLGVGAGFLVVLGAYLLPLWEGQPRADVGNDLLALSTIAISLTILWRSSAERAIPALMSTLFGLLYVPWMLSSVIGLYFLAANHLQGLLLVVLVVVMVKMTDAGALLFGLRFGRTRLAPQISPGKSWEGVAGGLATAAIASALFCILAGPWLPPNLHPLLAALIAIPVGAMAVAGDLFESVLKRAAKIKDSGGIVPGIGGALDVLDSLLLGAPLAVFLLRLYVVG